METRCNISTEARQKLFLALLAECKRIGVSIQWIDSTDGVYSCMKISLPTSRKEEALEILAHELVHHLQMVAGMYWVVPEQFATEASQWQDLLAQYYHPSRVKEEVSAWTLQTKPGFVLQALRQYC